MVPVGAKRLGSQKGLTEVVITFSDWKLNIESEKVLTFCRIGNMGDKSPSALKCSMWEPKRLGSQNSPMEVSVAVLGWKLDVESEKVGGCIGL